MADEPDPIDRLAQASSLVQATLERRADEHGISLIQTRLLGILRDRKPTMNELGALLGLDKSSTSGLVDRAERRGLVCRVPSQIDRRSVRVRLTDQGRGVAREVSTLFAGDIARMLEPLAADDRATLAGLLGRLVGDGAGRPSPTR